jgi:hypothetical protein
VFALGGVMLRTCPLCREKFAADKCPNCSGEADVERLMHDAFRGLLFVQGGDTGRFECAEDPTDIDDPVDREEEG